MNHGGAGIDACYVTSNDSVASCEKVTETGPDARGSSPEPSR